MFEDWDWFSSEPEPQPEPPEKRMWIGLAVLAALGAFLIWG